MVIRILAVDRLRSPYVAKTCDEFRRRLAPYTPYEEVEVRAGDGKDPRAAMAEESLRLARHLRPDDRVWLLDRTGAQVSSESLARRLEAVSFSGATRLTLVIGGAFGIDASLRGRAEFLWSLSELTFLHEWARMIVLEQLYRAEKILRNEPYHH